MKKVLITGAGSYIGTKVEKWLKKFPDKYEVKVIDMVGDSWKSYDFHGFDTVYHVAGIAHRKDATDELYEKVNHKLAVVVAEKALNAGVSQFIFMSSGAVYSQNDKKHRRLIVNENTELNPSTSYGISKMKAEKDINMIGGDMRIAIIRPPMVYGPDAKGNYNYISKIALKSPIFPRIRNKRSMIYIDNLCEFVRLLIDDGNGGIFIPQNKEYVNTSKMVKLIASCHGKRIILTPIFNWVVYLGGCMLNAVNKAFGDFYYERNNRYFDDAYQLVDFKTSIRITENI